MFILAGVLLTACGTENGIEVHRVWMSPAEQGKNSVVYFVMHNHASEPDELSSVTSDAAQTIALEESTNNGETMKKLALLPIEAFAEIEFAPGTYNILLIGLTHDLKVSDEIEITLHFKHNEDITLKVPAENRSLPEEEEHE
jgi:copper(I)-binding protein